MDSEREMKTYQETFEFVDHEIYSLKAFFEAMEWEFINTHIELISALSQRNKYKGHWRRILTRLLFLKVPADISIKM